MINQKTLSACDNYKELDEYLTQSGTRGLFLVCGKSIDRMRIGKYFETLPSRSGIKVVRFSDFAPNPSYESVVSGVNEFKESGCDAIMAVGGGSSMDVAKCIKLYSNMDGSKKYLYQPIIPNETLLLAVPTTAGSGSEATRYAVIYHNGEKQSIADDSCVPAAVLIDPSVLETLPVYQRKATMLDALCHSIESFWSVNSTVESKAYSRKALQGICANKKAYLENDSIGNAKMLEAANLAGKAINITQTTAGHAMCYKLTTLYGIAHGHAAALCLSALWPYMINNTSLCIDPRGENYLKGVLYEIADAMGCASPDKAVECFKGILAEFSLETPKPKNEDYPLLNSSVNPVRLKNHPIKLTNEAIDYLYHMALAENQAL